MRYTGSEGSSNPSQAERNPIVHRLTLVSSNEKAECTRGHLYFLGVLMSTINSYYLGGFCVCSMETQRRISATGASKS